MAERDLRRSVRGSFEGRRAPNGSGRPGMVLEVRNQVEEPGLKKHEGVAAGNTTRTRDNIPITPSRTHCSGSAMALPARVVQNNTHNHACMYARDQRA